MRAAGFTDDEIWDIGAITALFALSNRYANFTGHAPERRVLRHGSLTASAWSARTKPRSDAELWVMDIDRTSIRSVVALGSRPRPHARRLRRRRRVRPRPRRHRRPCRSIRRRPTAVVVGHVRCAGQRRDQRRRGRRHPRTNDAQDDAALGRRGRSSRCRTSITDRRLHLQRRHEVPVGTTIVVTNTDAATSHLHCGRRHVRLGRPRPERHVRVHLHRSRRVRLLLQLPSLDDGNDRRHHLTDTSGRTELSWFDRLEPGILDRRGERPQQCRRRNTRHPTRLKHCSALDLREQGRRNTT